MKLINFLIICAIHLVSVKSLNILGIFPYPYYSHQKFQHSIMRALVERGHNVTIFTTYPQDYGYNPNVTQHVYADIVQIHTKYVDMLMYKRNKVHWSQMMLQYELPAFYESAKIEMEHPEIQKLIHNSSNYKFDLLITECVFCPQLMFAQIYDCPIALISSSEAHEQTHRMMGNEINPLKYSEIMFLPYIHGQMTVPEQINSLIFSIFYETVFNLFFFTLTALLNLMYFPHLGRNNLKLPNFGLLMTNTNEAFGHVRPLMPNSIQIGYIHVDEPRQVTDFELRKFLDSSYNGVIVMALGSHVNPKSLGIENVKKFMAAFNQTNLNVLWKLHEVDENIEVPQNVEIVNWIPLADVLAHPNVKLLITHGGLLTSYEAIDREVPMIVFPLAYDQYFNARLMVQNEIAKELDLNTFEVSDLTHAIMEVQQIKYSKNIKKMRIQAYDRPISSKSLAVWHIENTAKKRVVYADRFGSSTVFSSPSLHIFAYFFVFCGSFYLLVRKKILKTQVDQ